jgi:calcineurin-like phosphoesterase
MPHRFFVGEGTVVFDAVLVDVDEATGKAVSIQRIQRRGDDEG